MRAKGRIYEPFPVVLVTGALIGIGHDIAIRYARAWARAGSACGRTAGPWRPGDRSPHGWLPHPAHRGHAVPCRRPRAQRSPGFSQMCGVGAPSRQRKCSGEDRVRRPSAAEVDGTASADAIELVLTERISHACKELK